MQNIQTNVSILGLQALFCDLFDLFIEGEKKHISFAATVELNKGKAL